MPKFPLPPDYFRCPPLSPDEITRLQALGERTSTDMVRASRLQGGSIKWTLASDIDGLQLYVGDDPSAPRGVTSYCGVTEVMGTLDEVASLFKTDAAERYHDYVRMFSKDHLDGQTLYTLSTESVDRRRHHLSLQWSASGMPGFAKHRDWCYLECQHDFTTGQGRLGWVRSFKSVKLTCCPDLESTFNVVRGQYHRSGIVVVESPSRQDHLVAMAVHQIDWKGSVPSFVAASAVRKRCRAVADLDTHLRARRMRGLSFLPLHRLVPFALRVKCFVCCARFSVFRHSKESCRQCGEVVCRACSRQWDVGTPQDKLHVRICAACSSQATPSSTPAPSTSIPSCRNSEKVVLGPLPTPTSVAPSHRAQPTKTDQQQKQQWLLYFPVGTRASQQRGRDGFPTPRNACCSSSVPPAAPRSTKARAKPSLFQDDDDIPPQRPRSAKARAKPSLFDMGDDGPTTKATSLASTSQQQPTRAPRTWEAYVDDRGSATATPHGYIEAGNMADADYVPSTVRVNLLRDETDSYTSRLVSAKSKSQATPPTPVQCSPATPLDDQTQPHALKRGYHAPCPDQRHGHLASYNCVGSGDVRAHKSDCNSLHRTPSSRRNTDCIQQQQSAGEVSTTSQDIVVVGLPHRSKPHPFLQPHGKESPAPSKTQTSPPRNDLIMIYDVAAPAGENSLPTLRKPYQPHASGPHDEALIRQGGIAT
ncbi:hypothetical protein H310_03108 [Aphanomyces invadans]|uniref:FYVE-type domain-containing protein n=1 Tax=Aphanomyces invadans TaxID=157072 RepID=A0A024UN28_9STRA|nr:hypothetical protein H310_03108 [Aphanomyces invadans]ETW07013.1 hypothetical protein H310_03108 [Aphanomyces invadans]|eukprot:XP_008865088.1 hypothetical protein H310_03108 [Aphanomyces invadans]